MGVTTDDPVRARARAWVDAVNASAGTSGGWRLEVLQMRSRRRYDDPGVTPGAVTDVNGDPVSSEGAAASDAGCDDLPVRLRRFVSGCPWALVDQAIRYLHEIAPYSGIVYNGVRSAGRYRPTLTQWRRDDQSQTRGDATYTLVQDLIEITECGDSLSVATGDACTAEETVEYRWDATSVEPVPTECAQGVTWSVRAVQRHEDGTFDYQLVQSVARTVHYGPVTVECGELATVTEEVWRNAYGRPGALEARGCRATGPVPSVSCDGPGFRTQVQLQMNADCTYDVVVRTRESLVQAPERWTEGTSCRPVSVTVQRNARTAPVAPAPRPGERVEMQSQRNEDGSWDSTVRVRAAESPYMYSWTDGSACRPRTVTVKRSQAAMPAVPSVSPGQVLDAEVSRNDDCTWDARFAVSGPAPEFRTSWREGSPCRSTDVTLVQGAAAIPAVPALARGRTVQASVSRNADCTYDGTVRVTSAASAETLEWTDGSPCRRASHKAWFSHASQPSVAPVVQGRTVSASLRRNDDCTYDGAEEMVASSPATVSWTEGSACRPVRSTVRFSAASVEVTAPGAGRTVQASVSRNADCTYDVHESVREAARAETLEWTDGTPCRRAGHAVTFSSPVPPSVPSPARGVTVAASIRRNDDCTYDGSVETVTSEAASASWTEGVSCRPTRVVMRWSEPSPPSVDVPAGGRASASVSRNADCTYDSVVRTTAAATPVTVRVQGGSASEHVSTELFEYRPSPPSPGPGGCGTSVDVSARMNEDCTWSGAVRRASVVQGSQTWTSGGACVTVQSGAVYGACSVVIPPASDGVVSASVSRGAGGTWNYQYSRTVHRQSVQPFEWESEDETDTYRITRQHKLIVFEHVRELPQFPHHSAVGVSVRLNEDCTWSGTISTSRLKSIERSGSAASGSVGENTVEKKFEAIVNGVRKTCTLKYKITVYEGSMMPTASQAAHHDSIQFSGKYATAVDLISRTWS